MPTKPLSKIHVHQLFNILKQLSAKIQNNPRVLYTITKLCNELNAEAVAVNEAMRPSPEFDAYQKKHSALRLEYAQLDENKKPKMIPGAGLAIADDKKAEFEEKLKTLMDENAAVLAEQNERSVKLQSLLNEPADTSISETLRIPVSCLPVGVTGAHIEVLFPILLDDAATAKA